MFIVYLILLVLVFLGTGVGAALSEGGLQVLLVIVCLAVCTPLMIKLQELRDQKKKEKQEQEKKRFVEHSKLTIQQYEQQYRQYSSAFNAEYYSVKRRINQSRNCYHDGKTYWVEGGMIKWMSETRPKKHEVHDRMIAPPQKGSVSIGTFLENVDGILYWLVEGDVQYTSDVKGGGVNVKGALAGAVLAGGAAAVIGSQLGTGTRTETVTHDSRSIVVTYKNRAPKKMDYSYFNVLQKLLYDKEYRYVTTASQN